MKECRYWSIEKKRRYLPECQPFKLQKHFERADLVQLQIRKACDSMEKAHKKESRDFYIYFDVYFIEDCIHPLSNLVIFKQLWGG